MLGRLLARTTAKVEERYNIGQHFGPWMASIANTGWTYSPVSVTVQRALTHAASSACIDVLATSVSTLPLDAIRQQGKVRRPVDPGPALITTPSVNVEQDVWLYQLVDSMLTDGNGFGLVAATDRLALPTQIELAAPATVTQRRVVDGTPQATIDGVVHQFYPAGDLWHIPGKYVRAGSPFAESPIDRAASTIGTALAAREFGGRFFGDGGHPGAIVKADQELSEEQASRIKAAFINAVRGNREPAVLGSGLTYEPIMVDPNDSQFIDLMRFCIEEACRFWRVPPSMVYAAVSGQNVTYANVSQADLHYLKHSLEGLLVRVERALSRLLTRPVVARFNRNAFLRSDPAGRNAIYDTRLKNKTMSVNEVRALEDEIPFGDPAYDLPGIPGIDDEARKLSAAEAVQKVYLGVDKVITADEAREIVNGVGGNLPVPGPQFTPNGGT